MTLPLSLKSANFLSLGKFFFENVLKDNYPHKKFEVESYKATTTNNNTIAYKTECVKQRKEEKTSYQIKDELKIGAKLWDQKYMQARIKRDGEIKYHFDFGTFVAYIFFYLPKMFRNKEHNFFAAIKTNMQLDKFWTRFGIGHVTPLCQFWARIEKDFQGEFSLSGTLGHQHGPFYFGISGIQNILTKKLQKFDIVGNYNKNGLDITLQHLTVQNDQCKFPLGKLLVAAAYKINNQYSVAAWFKKNMQNQKRRCVIGVQSNPSDKLMLKAKTDCHGKTSMSSKFQICTAVSCTVGTQLNFKEMIKNCKNKCQCSLPFGYSFDINI